MRNDCPCGSTIGPIISANTGIRAVDLGMPQVRGPAEVDVSSLAHPSFTTCSLQLSMHSIREMMGGADLTFAHKLFTTFFKEFRSIDRLGLNE